MLNHENPAETAALAKVGAAQRRRWAFATALTLSALAFVLIGAWAVWWRPETPPLSIAPADDDADEPLVVANPGYVGATVCAKCHEQRAADFQKTRHFWACCEPEAEKIAPGFTPGRGTLSTRDPSLHFEMTRSTEKEAGPLNAKGPASYSVAAVQATPQGEQRVTSRIALVYGAGGVGDEMYFNWRQTPEKGAGPPNAKDSASFSGAVFELPVAWLYAFDRWGYATYNPYAIGSSYGRETQPRCLECHNTWIAHVPGTVNQFRKDGMVLGVTCERCHGPGREHVDYHHAHPDAAVAHGIVHPGALTRDRLMDVCLQCHSNAIKPRGPAFRYRPGEPLDDYYRTIQTKHPEQDHVANQVQYLRQSKCFQKSELTCVTCHDPHRAHQAAAAQRACFKCHTRDSCIDRERLPAAVRDDCTSCHMPPRVWMNVHFHTTDDQYVPVVRRAEHKIGIHPEAKQAVLLAWLRTQNDAKSRTEADRLAKQLSQHWLAEADRRRGDYRHLAAIGAVREALLVDGATTTRQRLGAATALQAQLNADWVKALHCIDQRRYEEAIGLLKKVLEVKPDDALAHGKLGTMYAVAGKRTDAIAHLQAVAKNDPDVSYGHTMLGWLAYLDDRADEAAAHYKQADAIDPFDAKIQYHWGLSLLKLERLADAAGRFQHALKIDPRNFGASQGLSEALRRQGQAAAAVLHGRRSARWTDSQNADVLLTLAEAYAAANRSAEARTTLEQALTVAEATNAALVPQIRDRLRKLTTP